MDGGLLSVSILLALFFATAVASYIIGLVFSISLAHIFTSAELKTSLTKYGAMEPKLWNSVTNFLSNFLLWYFTFFFTVRIFGLIVGMVSPSMIDAAGSLASSFEAPLTFLTSLLLFIVLTISGLLAGGVAYKITTDGLESMGVTEQMKRHKIEGAFGGIEAPELVGSLAKWYIVLLFMNEGTVMMDLPVLSGFIGGLVAYGPKASSGIFILMASLLIAKFTAQNVRSRRESFSELYATAIETVIIFFGVVLSLPILFPDLDVSILTDSFKILMVGVSLGMALAVGLGAKDHIFSKKYSKI